MSLTMYSASVPVFLKMLGNLGHWLDAAETHATARKFDPAVLLSARLAPDMLPFTRQIQIACDAAKFCVARLAGIEAPKFEDNESTMAEVKQRVTKTMDFIKTVSAAQIDGTEGKAIEVPMRGAPALKFDGESYLKHFVLPNVYFHLTIAYALLRHNGVGLGKGDFLGRE